jgi:hypothetical protein
MARHKAHSKPTGPSQDAQNKKRILKMLTSDRDGIRHARTYAAEKAGFGLLDKSEQERRMTEAARLRVDKRIDGGHHVSCIYPEFLGYLPPSFYGQTGRVDDPDKYERLRRQIQALHREPASDDDDDDDYEEDSLPIKTEENTTKRKMSDFFPVTEKNETRLSKSATNPGRQDSANEQDNNDKTATAKRRSQGRNTTAQTSKRTRVDKSHYNNKDINNKEAITWRAVSRGQPLLPGSLSANFEHWKPKSNPWFGRVVFRGQITAEDGKDED